MKKTILSKGFLLLFLSISFIGRGQLYWRTDNTSATWTGSNWGTSSSGSFSTTWTSGSDVIFTANSTVSFATATVGNITVDNGFTVTVTKNGTLTFTSAGVKTYDVGTGSTLTWKSQGVTSNSTAGITKNGAGILDLGALTFVTNMTGGFTLNAGTVIVTGAKALGNGALTFNGGTLQSSGTHSFTPTSISIGGDFSLSGTGNDNWDSATTIALGAATRTITNNTTSGSRQFRGLISGSSGVGLTFAGSGSGQLYLGNTGNTFSGPVIINGGEVVFNDNGSLGAGNSITLDGGHLTMASIATDGTNSALTSATIGSGRTIYIGNTTGTIIDINGSTGVTTFDGVIADKSSTTGAFTKKGTGTLSLGGASTYTGSTSINNGTIKLTTGNNRLPTTTILNLGQASSPNLGTLDLNGTSQTIAGLNSIAGTNSSSSVDNTITSTTAATLTINNATDCSYGGTSANSGVITGSVTLIKNGSGSLVLGDDNSYTGKTTISAGLISVENESKFGTNPGSFVANQITLDGGGIFDNTLSFNFSSNRGITLSSNGGTFEIASTRTLTILNVITGSGGLTKTGAGLLLMTGGHTYSGLTTISAGTLQLNQTGGGTLPSSNNITINGGTLKVSSNQTLNNITLTSGTITIDDGITLTINGNLTRSNGTTITLGTGAAIQYGGSGILSYNGSSSQTVTAVEFPSTGGPQNLTINNSAGVIFPGSFNRTISGNLVLTLGSFDDGGNTLSVGGSITGTGTHSGSGKIIMTSSGQTISSATLQNIELSNAAGFSLSGSPTINGVLTFTSGKLTLGTNNLILASGTSISGASATNFIVTDGTGYLQRNNITTSTNFPVGYSSSNYNPVNISNSGTADNFRVRVANEVLDGGTNGTALTANSVNKTWLITEETAGGSNATLTLQWNSSDELSSFDRTNCYLSHFTSGVWVPDATANASGSNPYTISRTGITSFSPFGVGSGGALPIKLIKLEAKKVKETALITWATATEMNNDYFSIERKTGLGEYLKIGEVKANGNSSSIIKYSFIDRTPIAMSINYYRLVQHDYNGVSQVFGPVLVRFDNPISDVIFSPNPFENILTLNFDKKLVIEKVVVATILGKIICEQLITDSPTLSLNTASWPSGNYFITVSGPDFVKTFRQVK